MISRGQIKILGVLVVAIGVFLGSLPGTADTLAAKKTKVLEAQARRMTIVRVGYGKARIVGLWELNEGEVKAITSPTMVMRKPEDCVVPREIDLAPAQITIVYEMSPALLPASAPSIR